MDFNCSEDCRLSKLVELTTFLGRSSDPKYPSRPGSVPCKFFMQTGSCSFGSVCKYDHPTQIFRGVDFVPATNSSALTALTRNANHIICIEESASTLHFPSLWQAMTLSVELVEDVIADNIHGFPAILFPEMSELMKYCFPRFRTILQMYSSQHNEPYIRATIRRIDCLTGRWKDAEDNSFSQHSEFGTDLGRRHITDDATSWLNRFIVTENSRTATLNPVKGTISQTLRQHFQFIWPDRTVSTVAFGSSANGFGTGSSDLDLCLMMQGVEGCKEAALADKTQMQSIKEVFESVVSRKPPGFSIIDIVMSARIPIMKLRHDESGIHVDVCVNNHLAISNTKLLRQYAEFDARVRPLVVAVKTWAKHRGCNDARNSTLSSYAWTLLVLHYLQKRCSPPVLPNLMVKGARESFRGGNNSSVGQLFMDFFTYYGSGCSDAFDMHSTVVSIRPTALHNLRVLPDGRQDEPARPLLKICADQAVASDLHDQLERKSHPVAMAAAVHWRIAIEDPFEEHDLGRTVWARDGQAFIVRELRRAARIFRNYLDSFRSLSIRSVEKICMDASAWYTNPSIDVSDGWAEIDELLQSCDMDTFDTLPALREKERRANELFQELFERNSQIPNLLATCRCCGLAGHSSNQCGQERAKVTHQRLHQSTHSAPVQPMGQDLLHCYPPTELQLKSSSMPHLPRTSPHYKEPTPKILVRGHQDATCLRRGDSSQNSRDSMDSYASGYGVEESKESRENRLVVSHAGRGGGGGASEKVSLDFVESRCMDVRETEKPLGLASLVPPSADVVSADSFAPPGLALPAASPRSKIIQAYGGGKSPSSRATCFKGAQKRELGRLTSAC